MRTAQRQADNTAVSQDELCLAPAGEEQQLGAPRPRRKILDGALLAVLAFLLLVPAIQIVFRPLPMRPLQGMAGPGAAPKFTWETFKNDKFQKGVEQWFMKGNALWPWLVRVNNQLTFTLFNQISSTYATTIIVGREGQFIQPMYFNAFNRLRTGKKKVLDNRMVQLKRLQELLAQRGVPLLVVISTNVLELYPDLAPADLVDPTRFTRQNSYEIMRPQFDAYGINVLDAHQSLSKLKETSPIRFFEPTGSHWNDAASCFVAQELLTRLGGLVGKQLLSFPCEPYEWKFPPGPDDRDLVAITNLLFPEQTYRAAPYAPPGSPGTA